LCAASYFAACGWDWKQVTERMGHSDVRTTFNLYAKIVPGDEIEPAKKLDACRPGSIFSPGPDPPLYTGN
jgi:integrase